MNEQDFSNLSRPIQEMPAFIRTALNDNNVMDAYKSRPPYQQNDYLSWITRAKREATKSKRLNQMLAELKRGDKYMKMDYRPRRK